MAWTNRVLHKIHEYQEYPPISLSTLKTPSPSLGADLCARVHSFRSRVSGFPGGRHKVFQG